MNDGTIDGSSMFHWLGRRKGENMGRFQVAGEPGPNGVVTFVVGCSGTSTSIYMSADEARLLADKLREAATNASAKWQEQ